VFALVSFLCCFPFSSFPLVVIVFSPGVSIPLSFWVVSADTLGRAPCRFLQTPVSSHTRKEENARRDKQ
jgi:hypothetical protein